MAIADIKASTIALPLETPLRQAAVMHRPRRQCMPRTVKQLEVQHG